MQPIQFFNSTSSGNNNPAIKPVVVQDSLTIAAGTGNTLQELVNIPTGDCSPYGGQIVNSGCYDLQVRVKYLDGGDCDSCTADTLSFTCVEFVVPKNSVFPIPDGFFTKVFVGTLDSSRALVANTTDVSVDLYSSHVPTCGGCVSAPDPAVTFNGGRQTIVSGASWSKDLSGWPANGVNVWVWSLDNSINVKLNGQSIASVNEINFESGKLAIYTGGGLTADDAVLAGNTYVYGGAPFDYPNSSSEPLIKFNISGTGVVTATARVSAGNYQPLTLRNGATWSTLAPLTDECAVNSIIVGQSNLAPPTNANILVFSA